MFSQSPAACDEEEMASVACHVLCCGTKVSRSGISVDM